MRSILLVLGLTLCTACPPPHGGGAGGTDGGAESPDAGACAAWDESEMPAVAEVMGVFDEQRRRVVFFGGDDVLPENCSTTPHAVGRFEVYTFDAVCARFREEVEAEGPRARARGMAVYDPAGDRMLIFGGRSRGRETGPYRNYNDVWALDLGAMTWTEIEVSSSGPLARSNPAGGFNRATGELIVFGGNTSTNGLQFAPRNDVWALNVASGTWRRIEAQGDAPEARLFHAAAVDDANNRLFVFGGGDAGAWQGPFLGDLWMMDLATGAWTLLAAESQTGPAGRIWPTITYDPQADRVVLFGGHDDGNVGNNNDTWSFDVANRQWDAIIPAETVNEPANGFCNFPANFTQPNMDAPDRRSAHLAVRDTVRGEWLVFGGKTDCGIINDVWTYDLTRDAWINLLPATVGEACNRGDNPGACVAMCQ